MHLKRRQNETHFRVNGSENESDDASATHGHACKDDIQISIKLHAKIET